MTTGGFTVWHDGQLVDEADLIASGNPPAAPAPAQSEEWTIIEGHPQAGIEMRWLKGKQKQYRARCWIDDERYPGERGPVYSKEYKACDEADSNNITGYVINLQEAQYKQDIAAAVVRSHMKPDMAAMSDMRLHLRDLEFEVMRPYTVWMQRSARHVEQMSRTIQLREQIAMMVSDIEEFGMCDEYTTCIEQLQILLAKGKTSGHKKSTEG